MEAINVQLRYTHRYLLTYNSVIRYNGFTGFTSSDAAKIFWFGFELQPTYTLDLTWLVSWRSEWSTGHIPLYSIHLQSCLEPPAPSSSRCTLILVSPFLTPDLFSEYSAVAVFVCGLCIVSTVQLVWQCCRRFFAVCLDNPHCKLIHPFQFQQIPTPSPHHAFITSVYATAQPDFGWFRPFDQTRLRKFTGPTYWKLCFFLVLSISPA